MDGTTPPRVVFEKAGKRKRGSPWLAPLEYVERNLLRAGNAYTSELLRRHALSNRRKRDGWIEDAPDNVYRATRKAYRVYRRIAPHVLPK